MHNYYEILIYVCFGMLLSLVVQHFLDLNDKYQKKKKNKQKWKTMKSLDFTFNAGDIEFPSHIYLKTIAGEVIPEIIKIKVKNLNFQNVIVEKGKYDLEFSVNVHYKKKGLND